MSARRPVPTLIHDGKAWVEARHYDQARTDLDYLEDEARGLRNALAKINDLAKYLAEPAWTEEGCRLVGEQMMRHVALALAGSEQEGGQDGAE